MRAGYATAPVKSMLVVAWEYLWEIATVTATNWMQSENVVERAWLIRMATVYATTPKFPAAQTLMLAIMTQRQMSLMEAVNTHHASAA